jgi:hypothetical protein
VRHAQRSVSAEEKLDVILRWSLILFGIVIHSKTTTLAFMAYPVKIAMLCLEDVENEGTKSSPF